MGFIKVPPRFELRAHPVVPGTPFRVYITMHCREAVPIDIVRAEIVGRVQLSVPLRYGSGEPTHHTIRIGAQGFALSTGHKEFAAGRYSYHVDATIPAGLPGRQLGPLIRVDWTITLHASIPWWPDVRQVFPLHVVAAPRPPVPSSNTPRVVTSSYSGPAGHNAYAELSLKNSVVAPGGSLHGAVSLANARFHRYRQLRLKLVQRVDATMVSGTVRGAGTSHFMHLSAPQDHQPIPFRVFIPPTTGASFALPQLAMRWSLRCSVHSDHSAKVWVETPIDIVPASTQLPQTEHSPVLTMVGSDRIARVWSQVAVDTGYTFDGSALDLRTPRFTIRIVPKTGARGNRLDIEIRFEAIDIGLHAKRGRLRCHDATQSRHIANATDALTRWQPVTRADNRHLNIEANDGGTHRDRLTRYAHWAARLATTLLDVRAQLPAPASAAHLRPAFERAARRLDAQLNLAGMDVWGVRDGLHFSLETRFGITGRLLNTTIATGTSIPVDGRYRGRWSAPFDSEETLDGLAPLLEGATGLLIVDRGIEISYPPNPDRIEDYVERLVALGEVARRLSMLGGVYR